MACNWYAILVCSILISFLMAAIRLCLCCAGRKSKFVCGGAELSGRVSIARLLFSSARNEHVIDETLDLNIG